MIKLITKWIRYSFFFVISAAQADIIFQEAANGPFSSNKKSCFIYTGNDFTRFRGAHDFKDDATKTIIKALSPDEELGRAYGALFDQGGLGIIKVSEWNTDLRNTVADFYRQHQFLGLYNSLKSYINPNWTVTYQELHHKWGQKTYSWYSKVSESSTKIEEEKTHGLLFFSQNGKRFAVFKPEDRTGISTNVDAKDIHSNERYRNQLAARDIIDLLGFNHLVARGMASVYEYKGKKYNGWIEEYLATFDPEDLKEKKGVIFDVVKETYERIWKNDHTKETLADYLNVNASILPPDLS